MWDDKNLYNFMKNVISWIIIVECYWYFNEWIRDVEMLLWYIIVLLLIWLW